MKWIGRLRFKIIDGSGDRCKNPKMAATFHQVRLVDNQQEPNAVD